MTYIKAIVKTQNIYIKALSKGKNTYIKAQRDRSKTGFKLVQNLFGTLWNTQGLEIGDLMQFNTTKNNRQQSLTSIKDLSVTSIHASTALRCVHRAL